MLNELSQLADSLQNTGFSLGEGNPDVKDFFGDGLMVLYSEKRITVKSFGKSQDLWNYAPDNQMSFPAVKIPGPLLDDSTLPPSEREILSGGKSKKKDEDVSQTETQRMEALIHAAQKCAITADEKTLKKFWKVTQDRSVKLQEKFGDKWAAANPLAVLIQSLSALGPYSLESAQKEMRRLADAIIEGLESGAISLECAKNILVGKPQKDDQKPWTAGDTVVYLDLPDRTVQKKQVRLQFESILSVQAQSADGLQGECALTGKRGSLVEGTFAQVNVPVFAQKTALMAMNKDVHCHQRYGQIAAAIYPVGTERENEIVKALTFIVSPDNNNKTWKRIDADKKAEYDLLIVYCESHPHCDVPMAQSMDDWGETDDNELSQEGFEDTKSFLYKTVEALKAVEGTERESKKGRVKCLILREYDPGRRQILYADSFTVEELDVCAQRWSEGAYNVPDITMPIPLKKGEPPCKGFVLPISFKNAQALYSKKWIRGGYESEDVQGVSRSDIFSLFLNRPNAKFNPEKMLSLLLDDTKELFSAVGNNLHGSRTRNLPYNAERLALRAIALTGVLLNTLNSKKEVYMKGCAYNLGRLLSLADSLHTFYCLEVRNGDVPLGLIGNAHLPVMQHNPAKGLKRLQERMRIYIAWAKKYQYRKDYKENSGQTPPRLVGWLQSEFGNVENAITDGNPEFQLPETPMTDQESAQMFLGYLATSKKRESNSEDASIPDSNETEQE